MNKLVGSTNWTSAFPWDFSEIWLRGDLLEAI